MAEAVEACRLQDHLGDGWQHSGARNWGAADSHCPGQNSLDCPVAIDLSRRQVLTCGRSSR